MTIAVPKPSQTALTVLRRANYTPLRDPRTGTLSYVRRLGPNFYPRFHLYVEEGPERWRLDLHLDQKQASYRGSNRHSGEYDGATVSAEAMRLQKFF